MPHGGIHLDDEPLITRPRGDEESGNQSSGDQPAQSYKSAVVQLRTSLQIDRVRQRLQQEKALASGNASGSQLQVPSVVSNSNQFCHDSLLWSPTQDHQYIVRSNTGSQRLKYFLFFF